MAQKLVQTQSQTQTQTLAPQQLLLVKMLELPVSELEERVRNELMDNAALEECTGSEADEALAETDTAGDTDGDETDEYGLRDPQSEDALADYLSADDAPDYLLNRATEARERNEIPFGESTSFYESLKQQIGEHNLNEHQQTLVEYLIGSLDDDGLLRKDMTDLADELAIYHGIETTPEELEAMRRILLNFEPRGIGACSLQECLLLQLRSPEYRSPYKETEIGILQRNYEDFTHKRWDRIALRFGLDDEALKHVQTELKRLNPRPGAAMDEVAGHNLQTVIPDFLVENDANGDFIIRLNQGDVPELRVSRSFRDSVEAYNRNRNHLNRDQRDAFLYTKQKVDAAQSFIEAIRQRRHTLLATMEAIVELQRPFFEEGDETLLTPMILRDVAIRAGLDISTVSRVSNSKYVQTYYGIYPLKFFFNDKFTTEDGEELSTLHIKNHLRQLIEAENKQHPLTDEQLAAELKTAGYPVARRTVAKYREQLGIPVARLRR